MALIVWLFVTLYTIHYTLYTMHYTLDLTDLFLISFFTCVLFHHQTSNILITVTNDKQHYAQKIIPQLTRYNYMHFSVFMGKSLS